MFSTATLCIYTKVSGNVFRCVISHSSTVSSLVLYTFSERPARVAFTGSPVYLGSDSI